MADPECPLPTQNPRQPFFIRFRGNLAAECKRRLEGLGLRTVRYFYPQTWLVRADEGADLEVAQAALQDHPLVAGTALRQPVDVSCDRLAETDDSERVLRVLFLPDATPDQAVQALSQAGAEIVSATTDARGQLNLETRFVDAVVAADGLALLLESPWVEFVEPRPVLTLRNQNSVALSRADAVALSPYQLNGSGQVVGIWDGGAVDDTHPDLAGRVFVQTTRSVDSHATHVMGTILGSGASDTDARGFAPSATGYNYSFYGSVYAERRSLRHAVRHVVDNHSYGNTSGYGGYDSTSVTADLDNRDLLLIQCKSAGNDGSGSQTITSDDGMKNALIVGATDDQGTIAGLSSRGPMLDGRLSPQVCANGVYLYSTVPGGYASYSGTSMSSPSAAGGVTLLCQLWEREHGGMQLAPDVARAVLCQTADDRGNQGPDYQYGFGVMDVQAAADLVLQDKSSGGKYLVRGIARQGSISEYEFSAAAGQAIRVTLNWLDAEASSGASVVLVNDLDLELVDPNGGVHYPWSGLTAAPSSGGQTTQFVQTGPNTRDNTELAEVSASIAGTWKVRVRGAGVADPDTPVGFVLASSHALDRTVSTWADPVNQSSAVAIPDGSASGLSRVFAVSGGGQVAHVRVYCSITHTQRGDLEIYLRSPDGTEVLLEGSDANTRDDIFAIYPDTRKYDDDVTTLYGKLLAGIWTVRIADVNGGQTGELHYLTLEFEVEAGAGPANHPPVADAGGAQSVAEGDSVALNASASQDPDGDLLVFAWTQTAGPTAALTGASSATPTFIAPQVSAATTLTFQVSVSDGRGGTDSDTVSITVNDGASTNRNPVANAGADFMVTAGQPATLDGTGSTDPDGDPLTYQWQQIGGTTVGVSGSTSATAAFHAPTTAGTLEFRLTVSDGRGGVHTDTVSVQVLPGGSGASSGGSSGLSSGGGGGGGGGCATGAGGALWALLILLGAAIVGSRLRRT